MLDGCVDTSLLRIGEKEFELFRTLIHQQTGIWLREGKQIMLASRLAKRVRAHRLGDFAEYYRFLQSEDGNGVELGELINCITTNKTAFFRERHHFDFLLNSVLEMVRQPATAGTLRSVSVWSAACSTGEEPYSIAMTLLEARRALRGTSLDNWDMHIAASDVDTGVLAKAMRGVYPIDSVTDIDPDYRKRYLLRGSGPMSGQFKVKKEIAQNVEFQHLNLMDARWPLATTFDFIFFRNALIYFQQDVQDLFLRRMIRLLKPGGYLFLGHSENIPWLHDLVQPLQHTVYQVRGAR